MNTQAFSCLRGRAGRYAATALGAVAVLAFGGFAPAAAQAAAPTTLYVSPGGNDTGTCPVASPCATVGYALTQAASGATINVTGTIINNVTISHPVTIATWPGHSPAVLDGTANNAAVVSVGPGVTGITLLDLTIENGNEGIYDDLGTLTLTQSTVSGNSGPGIDTDGTVTVTDSTITNNAIAGIKQRGDDDGHRQHHLREHRLRHLEPQRHCRHGRHDRGGQRRHGGWHGQCQLRPSSWPWKHRERHLQPHQ